MFKLQTLAKRAFVINTRTRPACSTLIFAKRLGPREKNTGNKSLTAEQKRSEIYSATKSDKNRAAELTAKCGRKWLRRQASGADLSRRERKQFCIIFWRDEYCELWAEGERRKICSAPARTMASGAVSHCEC